LKEYKKQERNILAVGIASAIWSLRKVRKRGNKI
jgi:hypothetical protein